MWLEIVMKKHEIAKKCQNPAVLEPNVSYPQLYQLPESSARHWLRPQLPVSLAYEVTRISRA